jgi:hypothetical protein
MKKRATPWHLRQAAALLVVFLGFWWWFDHSGRRDRSWPVSRAEELVADKVLYCYPGARFTGWGPHQEEEGRVGVLLVTVRFEQLNSINELWRPEGVFRVLNERTEFVSWKEIKNLGVQQAQNR